MRESIEGRSGESFAAEDFGPVLKRQVRCHDEALAFVRRADHVE